MDTDVTIGQCISIFVWATVVGIGISLVWSTVGGSRLPSDLVSVWVIRAGLVASPAVTRKGIQSVSCS